METSRQVGAARGSRFLSLDEVDRCRGDVVVVDVLRAFTTAGMAVVRGVDEVVLVETVDEALALRGEHPEALLAGEYDTRPIEGFDLSTSPVEMIGTDRDLQGRRLILRTTSGTRAAVRAAGRARRLWCAGFVSALATARRLGDTGPVDYVVSGRSAERAGVDDGDDDLAVAELIESLRGGDRSTVDDARRRVQTSRHAQRLHADGHPAADVLLATSDVALAPALELAHAELGWVLHGRR